MQEELIKQSMDESFCKGNKFLGHSNKLFDRPDWVAY